MNKKGMCSFKDLTAIAAATVMIFATPVASAKKAPSSGSSGGSHNVNGHFKKNGTYVAPHRSTNPNHTQRDNWSSKPNVNPYNGKQGTKEPKH
jgi:hypothetical protein